MTMQQSVTLHSKESAIVRCVIADSIKTLVKKVSPHYCPAMDTKKLKKRGNLNIVNLKSRIGILKKVTKQGEVVCI